MRGGFVPRFAVEAGFLILIGIGAGIADLRPIVIVALVAGAWLVVSLFELAVWHAQGRPVETYLPPPLAAVERSDDGDGRSGLPGEEPAIEADENAYPLRPDAGTSPSDEVEEYTRILGEGTEADPPGEAGD